MTVDDRHLIRRFKRGSTEALAAIYDRYAGLLVKVAGGMLNDRSAAEDIVHDTFVKFARSADTLKIRGSLKAYLVACVTNRVRDRLRKKSPAAMPAEGSTLMDPPCEAMRHETRQIVRQALASIPDEQREVIVLRIHADLTFREIARMLGLSENTAQSRCRYGMDKLRLLLDGERMP